MTDFASYEDLGKMLADAIVELEAQRLFTGDMQSVFTVPLEDGTEYEVSVLRKGAA